MSTKKNGENNAEHSLWQDKNSVIDLTTPPSSPVLDRKRKRQKSAVEVSKKPVKWVMSAFDDFGVLEDLQASSEPITKLSGTKKNNSSFTRSSIKSTKTQEFHDNVPSTQPVTSAKHSTETKPSTSQSDFFSKFKVKKNDSDLSASNAFSTSQNSSSSHKHLILGKKRPKYETDLWSDKYSPALQSELAVHRKKIGEVETWIKEHLHAHHKVPPMLLLTGQAGTGKSTTVKVLTSEQRCDIQDWINPVGVMYEHKNKFSRDFNEELGSYDGDKTESQLAQFQQFLLRADKYNTLDIFGGGHTNKKIILVEEFPNIFFRDASAFHDVLRKYAHVGESPLIFIVSDSTSGESNERLLFPKDLQQELCIANISFNPIALTSMIKVLTRIATAEANQGTHKFEVPSRVVLESIAMSSSGDLRGAINALQFACLRDTSDLMPSKGRQPMKKQTSKRGRKGGSSLQSKTACSETNERSNAMAAIGGRDTSLFLFRALGKILYCKREEDAGNNRDLPKLPVHLSQHERDPLVIHPEEVVDKCHLSGEYFSAYLHQNYLDFYTDIKDLERATEYLSDSDYLTIDWVSRSALQHYAASVATRGLIHCNSSRAKASCTSSSLGWRPLHKPQWYTVCKQARQNSENARFLFKGYPWTRDILHAEILPYLSLINMPLHDPGQINYLQEISRFSSSRFPARSEKLDEKDVDINDSTEDNFVPRKSEVTNDILQDDEIISNSQSNVKISQEKEEEEELIIEDYDD